MTEANFPDQVHGLPEVLLTLARVTRLPGEPWVTMVQGWLASYLVCGLVLALLARQLRRPAA